MFKQSKVWEEKFILKNSYCFTFWLHYGRATYKSQVTAHCNIRVDTGFFWSILEFVRHWSLTHALCCLIGPFPTTPETKRLKSDLTLCTTAVHLRICSLKEISFLSLWINYITLTRQPTPVPRNIVKLEV